MSAYSYSCSWLLIQHREGQAHTTASLKRWRKEITMQWKTTSRESIPQRRKKKPEIFRVTDAEKIPP